MKKVKRNNCPRILLWRDAGITVLIMALCTGICAGLGKIWWENPLIFLLYGVAVFLTAYCTEGFRFGTAAALLSMALLRVLFMDTLWPTLSGLAVDLLIGLCLFLLSFLTGCLKENRKQWAQQREQAKLFHVLYEEFYAATKRGLYGSAALIKEENEWMLRLLDEAQPLIVERLHTQIAMQAEAVEEVVSEAVRRVRRHYPGIALRAMVPQKLLFVSMNAVLLEQALQLLLESTALSGDFAAQLCLRVTAKERMVEFYITGNRREISQERFAFCNRIIQAHGGTLQTTREPEGSVTYFFLLPAAGS